jgi:hypothetical protein
MKYKITEYDERYFLGIEYEGGVAPGSNADLNSLWTTFLKEDVKLLEKEDILNKFIGLECYPPDFAETRMFDYYALVQTKHLVKHDGFSSKKLPKGKYIEFVVSFDNLHEDIKQVYKYIKDNNINVHFGFDYEDYLESEDYWKDGATLQFALKLEE